MPKAAKDNRFWLHGIAGGGSPKNEGDVLHFLTRTLQAHIPRCRAARCAGEAAKSTKSALNQQGDHAFGLAGFA